MKNSQKELVFNNGDKIIFNEAGNTYIGENANKVMLILHKYCKTYAEELEIIRRVIVPNTNGLVLINF